MQVSVAMATFNGERFLLEQLDSVARQTVLPAELVISDDGSADDTLSIIERFSQTAPFPIRILRPSKRLGFAQNFLDCAMACRHELIAFCDQDDVWLPRKIETARDHMLRSGSLLSLHQLMLTDERLQVQGLFDQSIPITQTLEPLTLDPYKTGWGNTMLFHHALTRVIDPRLRPLQPEAASRTLSHDQWIYTLAAALGRVSQIAEPLILYRQHGSNAMGYARLHGRAVHSLLGPASGMACLKERYAYYQAIAVCFEAAAKDPHLSDAAARAERSYRLRATVLKPRLDIYFGQTLPDRLRALADFRRTSDHLDLTTLSKLKDICLGVSGLQMLSMHSS